MPRRGVTVSYTAVDMSLRAAPSWFYVVLLQLSHNDGVRVVHRDACEAVVDVAMVCFIPPDGQLQAHSHDNSTA
jgi:hypothetical protein